MFIPYSPYFIVCLTRGSVEHAEWRCHSFYTAHCLTFVEGIILTVFVYVSHLMFSFGENMVLHKIIQLLSISSEDSVHHISVRYISFLLAKVSAFHDCLHRSKVVSWVECMKLGKLCLMILLLHPNVYNSCLGGAWLLLLRLLTEMWRVGPLQLHHVFFNANRVLRCATVRCNVVIAFFITQYFMSSSRLRSAFLSGSTCH